MFNLEYKLTSIHVNKINLTSFLFVLLLVGCSTGSEQNAAESTTSKARIQSPEVLYGDLFYEVQTRTDLFPDSKTFVDAIPKREIKQILADFEALSSKEETEVMLSFLKENFVIPGYEEGSELPSASSASEHISNLWSYLERSADPYLTGTKIPLPSPYIVPGGRFREVYYWDSYFTMLGLKVDGRNDLIDNVVNNFSFLIDSVGFIPNGNRAYYNTRSQPPFYSLMVALSLEGNQAKSLENYHEFLLKEYNFWMSGAEKLSDTANAHRRVVRMSNGGVLNRYWDDSDTPRPESYREDIETVEEALKADPERSKEASYRHLRAAAESGWDFSTRWFEIDEEEEFHLSTIHTTEIIPVDLNALLYHLELMIARSFEYTGMQPDMDTYREKARKRKELLIQYCWSAAESFFMDYDFIKEQHTPVKSLAGLYPLFFEIASKQQAKEVSEVVNDQFLMKGGVVTTLNDSGQQWDYPNGWAPLQWMTIKGLRNYGHTDLADEIKSRWLELNENVFDNTGKMTEKYNVVDMSLQGGGGEYPNQDGFGWTNGVFQKLYKEDKR